MSTRGTVKIINSRGQEKIFFTHFDSNISVRGKSVMHWIRDIKGDENRVDELYNMIEFQDNKFESYDGDHVYSSDTLKLQYLKDFKDDKLYVFKCGRFEFSYRYIIDNYNGQLIIEKPSGFYDIDSIYKEVMLYRFGEAAKHSVDFIIPFSHISSLSRGEIDTLASDMEDITGVEVLESTYASKFKGGTPLKGHPNVWQRTMLSKGAKLDYAKELFKSFTDFYTNKLEESAGSAESVINELSEDFILSIMLGDGGSALKGKGEDLSRLFIGQDIEVYKEHLEAKKRAIHYINKGTSYPLFTIIAPLLKVYFLKV